MGLVEGDSSNSSEPAVKGTNTGKGGIGVRGTCETGYGIRGESTSSRGVYGSSDSYQGVYGKSRANAGVVGESTELHGVYGDCHNPHGAGVFGTNDQGGLGVEGYTKAGRGVWGHSETGDGVVGTGVRGVVGESDTFQGVYGKSRDNAGIVGESANFHAVYGVSHNPNAAGIFGTNDKGGLAGLFDGRVSITGDCLVSGDVLLPGADLAEDFAVVEVVDIDPGTVMVLDGVDRVRMSDCAYDGRVAGVVSGAGEYRPAVVLDHRGQTAARKPLALVGKVFCKVDASYAGVAVGDLLTTSPTPGHAMKVLEPAQAFGAVLGKAMAALDGGVGLVPVLVGLH